MRAKQALAATVIASPRHRGDILAGIAVGKALAGHKASKAAKARRRDIERRNKIIEAENRETRRHNAAVLKARADRARAERENTCPAA